MQSVPGISCSKSEGAATKDSADFGDGEFDQFTGSEVEVRVREVQKGGEVVRCFSKYGFVDELKPVVEPSGVERSPVYQVVQVTVVSCVWSACGKTDGRMVESVKFAEWFEKPSYRSVVPNPGPRGLQSCMF